MLRVTINGTDQEVPSGQTVLNALRSIGIGVPSLCYDPRLESIGNCRLCLVEIERQARPVAACMTMLTDRMRIFTHTSQLEELRRTQLRLLARQIPRDFAEGGSSSEFAQLLRAYGLTDEFIGTRQLRDVDDSHPCISVDMSRCVQCLRCVRICSEVAGRFVWRPWYRGDRTEIRPAGGVLLGESNCVSCGACVDTCPTLAIRDKRICTNHMTATGSANEVRTVCPYCGTGCEMYVGRRAGKLTSVRPALDAAVNRGHLCVKGRYGWDFVHASDRITQPMIRIDDDWKVTSWDQAVEFVAQRLSEIIARRGSDAVGMLGSARATNEENYLIQKFARVVIGTNNIDCCARVCHAPTAAGMKTMLGTGAATNSFDDIELAHSFLICGANPTENHPIVGDRIRQAVLRGAELIVIDPRRIDLSDHARVHLQLHPGTNVPLLNAIANVIVEEGLCDAIAAKHLGALPEFRKFIAAYSPDRVADICGVSPALIREAARIYATCSPAMCFHGLGITEHVQGTHGVMCLVNLALLTANIGRPGAGINPLRGQNNVQGAVHMGCDPELLTGSVALAENRGRFSAIWKSRIPVQPGLNLLQMMDAAKQGRLNALWVVGYDIALTNPNAAETRKALRALELLVVQDLFLNETARDTANVFLPACSAFEKDGTFMNSERRIQRIRKVIDPVGESKSDGQIISLVAQAMGYKKSFHFQMIEDVWNEIRSVWPAGAGITYQRLGERGLQWPCPTEDHPGTNLLHAQIFAGGCQLQLQQIEYSPTAERTSEHFPLLLVTGRALYQFNSGTMTNRSVTAKFQPEDVVELSPIDASRYGIADGQCVCLRSKQGEIKIRSRISNRVNPGELFATFQSPAVYLNLITGPRRDSFVHTPEFKVTAVALHPVIENGEAMTFASKHTKPIL